MNASKIETARAIIADSGSKFFTVTFTKKSGETRKLNCHVYNSPLHTGKNTVAHLQQYQTVILPHKVNGKLQFRNVNLESITRIAARNKVYNF